MIERKILTSLQTRTVPKTTCRPSKKLSPMIITVEPPEVQPSLGDIAFIQGVAICRGGYKPEINGVIIIIADFIEISTFLIFPCYVKDEALHLFF